MELVTELFVSLTVPSVGGVELVMAGSAVNCESLVPVVAGFFLDWGVSLSTQPAKSRMRSRGVSLNVSFMEGQGRDTP